MKKIAILLMGLFCVQAWAQFQPQAYTTQKVAQVDAHVQAVATNPPEWNGATNVSYIYPNVTVGPTNEIVSIFWGDSANNSPFFWNPSFNAGGSHGAFTNINGRVLYNDIIGVDGFAGLWDITTWPTNGSSSQAIGGTTPEYSSWQIDNGTGAAGYTYFSRNTNLISANFIVNAMGYATAHVYVATNGWTAPYGWVSETNAGQSLSDALAYYGLANSASTVPNGGNISYPGYYFNTNWTGGTFELGPAPAWVNPFYIGGPFMINNQNGESVWDIYGQGNETCILGDSNVLVDVVNNSNPLAGSSGSPISKQHVHDLLLCVSNNIQKAVAVNLYGNGFMEFDRNTISAYLIWNPGNFFLNADTAATPPPPPTSGFIDLLVNGADGQQVVHNNVIANGAVGIIALSEHQRYYDNEYHAIQYPNQYSSSDTFAYYVGATANILGCEMAIGPTVIFAGSDTLMSGDKSLGCGVGAMYLSGGGSREYGVNIMQNVHWEGLKYNAGGVANACVVVVTNSGGVGSVVQCENCFDQEIALAPPMFKAYSFDTNAFALSSTSFGKDEVIQDGWCTSTHGSLLQYAKLINNVQIPPIVDPNIFLLSLPAGWIFNGGSSQITNVITAPAAGSTNAVGETADGRMVVDTTSGIGGIGGIGTQLVMGFFGGFTNAQVGQATAPSTFSADGGNSVPTFVPPGTYTNFTINVRAVTGTNLVWYVSTNGVPTGITTMTTGSGSGVVSSGFTIGNLGQTSITIGVSNNAGAALSIPAATWSMQLLVQSVSSTAISTNSIVGAPDFSKPYGLLTTNQSFILSNPLHDSAGVVNQTVFYITNSSGTLINITSAGAWGNHTNGGAWNCTNVSVITVVDYAQGFTNAILSPLW